MGVLQRAKNRAIARAVTRYPSLARGLIDAGRRWEFKEVPWVPGPKPLMEAKVALITTAGVHHREQPPFDMRDRNGDPSFREIDSGRPLESLMITHDYYDHSDADRDINVVFPAQRLMELKEEGLIGAVSGIHLGFMGHIDGPHINTLLMGSAPEAARRLKAEGVDVALLTPG
jgi:D-proline reductase (dithiol) PrdB